MTSKKGLSRCHVYGLENGIAVKNLSPVYNITSGILRQGVLPPKQAELLLLLPRILPWKTPKSVLSERV